MTVLFSEINYSMARVEMKEIFGLFTVLQSLTREDLVVFGHNFTKIATL